MVEHLGHQVLLVEADIKEFSTIMKNGILDKKGLSAMAIIFIIFILIIAVLAYFSFRLTFSSTTGASSSPTGGGNQIYNVNIENFSFSQSHLNIQTGDTVVWTNNDKVPHTVSSDSGSELSSPTLSPGDTYSHTFDTAGSYSYHCNIHPNMKGGIIVS